MSTWTYTIPRQTSVTRLDRIQRQTRGRRFASAKRELLAHESFELHGVLLQLLFAIRVIAYSALEESPCQPALDPFPSDIFQVCALEPATDVILEVARATFGDGTSKKLFSIFSRAHGRMDRVSLEVEEIGKLEGEAEDGLRCEPDSQHER